MSSPSNVNILLLEPFYGGSHKQFVDTLMRLGVDYDQVINNSLPRDSSLQSPQKSTKQAKWPSYNFTLFTMKAKKWHWRARTSSLYMSMVIPKITTQDDNGNILDSVLQMTTNSLNRSNRIGDHRGDETMPDSYDIMLVSSVLNLAELCSLRPDLGRIPKKIVYFHENQLAYPTQNHKQRDFQYGYNQILTW